MAGYRDRRGVFRGTQWCWGGGHVTPSICLTENVLFTETELQLTDQDGESSQEGPRTVPKTPGCIMDTHTPSLSGAGKRGAVETDTKGWMLTLAKD